MHFRRLIQRSLPVAGVAGIALIATPAIAECPRDIDQVRRELLGNSGFQDRYTRGGVDTQDYRALFGAARMFSDMGMEQRCQDVLAGIRQVAKKAERADKPDRGTPADAQRRGERTQTRERDREQAASDDSQPQWMKSAKSLASADVSGGVLIGADVRNTRNRSIGEIDDFVVRNNSLHSVIVAADGAHYRVPADQLKIAWRGQENRRAVIVLDMTRDQLRSRPKVERQNDRWIAADSGQRRDRQAQTGDRRDENATHQSLKRPDGAWVSITGKVKAATDEALVLQYAKGKGHIVVEMNGLGKYATMYDTMAGHRVTVTGIIERTDLDARRILAGTVYDHNNSTYYVGEAGDNYYYYSYNRRPYGYYGYWGPTYTTPSYRAPRGTSAESNVETTFTIHGEITQAGSDEFVVQSGVGALQVDVDELADNPLDTEGRPQLKVGDHVSVTGRLDDEDLFDRREIIATQVTLRARSGQLKTQQRQEERIQ